MSENIISFPKLEESKKTSQEEKQEHIENAKQEMRELFANKGWFDDKSAIPDQLIDFLVGCLRSCYREGKKTKTEKSELMKQDSYLKGYEEGYIQCQIDFESSSYVPEKNQFERLVKVRLLEEIIARAQDLDIKPREAFARLTVAYTDGAWELQLETDKIS